MNCIYDRHTTDKKYIQRFFLFHFSLTTHVYTYILQYDENFRIFFTHIHTHTITNKYVCIYYIQMKIYSTRVCCTDFCVYFSNIVTLGIYQPQFIRLEFLFLTHIESHYTSNKYLA